MRKGKKNNNKMKFQQNSEYFIKANTEMEKLTDPEAVKNSGQQKNLGLEI